MPVQQTNCPRCRSADIESDFADSEAATCKQCGFSFPAILLSAPRPFDGDSDEEHEPDPDLVPLEWAPGDLIMNRYEVKSVLGEGGMGRVYKVHHRGWNVDLAVKSPRAEILESPGAVENFESECETWINLGLHPHIVSCYYVRRLGKIPRIFAEYVEGGGLDEWIQSRRLYEGGVDQALKRMLDVAIQFAWGLHFAHCQELVHQDVKPANVMVTKDLTAKVTDFGLAKAQGISARTTTTQGTGSILVSSGGLTPAYCSPEQANGEKLTRRTDLWSWGVSLLHMFAGDVFWPSGSIAAEVLDGFLERVPMDERLPPMPEGIAELLRRSFQADQADRPKDLLLAARMVEEIYREVTGADYPRSEPQAAENLADNLHNRAVSMLDLGRKKDAEDFWEQALTMDPHHPASAFGMGQLLWRSGRIADDEFVRQLNDVRTTHTDNWFDEYLLGLAHMERGDAESAIEMLLEAEGSGGGPEVSKMLARARSSLGDAPKCQRVFEGHERALCDARFNQDGRFALSLDRGGTARVWGIARGECLRVIKQDAGTIHAAVFGPQGDFVITGDGVGKLQHWDIASGHASRSYVGHKDAVTSLALNKAGMYALSGGLEKTIRLWDVQSGENLRELTGHEGAIKALRFGADNRYVLSGSSDGSVRLWEIATGRCALVLEEHTADVNTVCFSGGDRFALSGSRDQSIRLWDVRAGRCIRVFQGHTDSVESVAFSPSGRFIMSGSLRSARLWEVATGRCLHTFQRNPIATGPIALSQDGLFALTQLEGHQLGLWTLDGIIGHRVRDRRTGVPICRMMDTIESQRERETFETYLKQARAALDGGDDVQAARLTRKARGTPHRQRDRRALKIWNELTLRLPRTGFRSGWFVRSLREHTNNVNGVCLSHGGRWALTAAESAYRGEVDSTLRLWDVATGKCVRSFGGFSEWVRSAALSMDGRYALAGTRDNRLHLWEVATGRRVVCLEGQGGYVDAVSLSADGRMALSGGKDHALKLWSTSSGQCVRTYTGHQGDVVAVHLSLDGRYALSSGSAEDPTIRLWDVSTGRCLRVMEGHQNTVSSVRFTSDQRHALSACFGGSLCLWDLGCGRCLKTTNAHTRILDAALTSDARFVIGACDDVVRIWDIADGTCLREFEGHTDTVNAVGLSGDGRLAVSGSDDNTARIWELDWDLQEQEPADWDEGARPHLEVFLTRHMPYAGQLPRDREPTEQETVGALTRQGAPSWNDNDFRQLLDILAGAGYGWLRPEGVGRELEEMARHWSGPPTLA